MDDIGCDGCLAQNQTLNCKNCEVQCCCSYHYTTLTHPSRVDASPNLSHTETDCENFRL